ncbi:phosphatase PAP2 family protein [Jatrophihabitans fulvus]
MQAVALDWEQAAVLTAGLAAASAGLTLWAPPRARRLAPFAREATMIAGLYALWQLAGRLSVLGTSGAFARAEWIERVERDVHLPSEATVQRVLTTGGGVRDVVAQVANLYYATMHFGVLFVFLLWLFLRHRDRYRQVRRVLAMTTFVCLLVQLLPVAPPRLLPGYEDTAEKFGQSVYGLGFGADELSAMPSVHVAWAVLVGVAVWRIADSRWRWLGPAHAVVTVVVVVATANHFWADGIVAVAIMAVCAGVERTATRVAHRTRRDVDANSTPAPAPVPADG